MLNNELQQLKERLKQNVVRIIDFNGVDDLLYFCTKDKYVIFDSISLKNYFISSTDRTVINCNSSYDKFIQDMNMYFDEKSVFNNVNFCNDFRILNMIDKTNNLRLE